MNINLTWHILDQDCLCVTAAVTARYEMQPNQQDTLPKPYYLTTQEENKKLLAVRRRLILSTTNLISNSILHVTNVLKGLDDVTVIILEFNDE